MESKSEFWDKVYLHCARYSDNMLHCIIELNGIVDMNRLKEAFKAVLGLNSVLTCRLVRNGNKVYWQSVDYVIDDYCKLFDDGKMSVEEYLTMPIDIYDGIQMRIAVFRSQGADKIAVMLDRIVADTVWLSRIVELLSQKYNDSNFKVPVVSDRDFRHFFKCFKRKERLTILKLKQNTLPKGIKYAHYPSSRAGGAVRPKIISRTLTPEVTENVKLYSEHIGVSIDDICIAAYARSINEFTEENRAINIDCAIDLRNYLIDEKKLFTNYISHTNVNIGDDIGDELVDTIFKVNLALEHSKSNYTGLDGLRRLFLHVHFTPIDKSETPSTRRFTRSALLFINNGELNIKSFGGVDVVKAFVVNSIKNSRFAELNLSFFNDTAMVSLPVIGNEEDYDTAEKLLDNMCRQFDALHVIHQYKQINKKHSDNIVKTIEN